jgi:PAS domain S-box-containing protein
MDASLRVLMIEDSDMDAQLILREVQRGGYLIEHQRIETRAKMEEALSLRVWDVILCDYTLPQFNAMEALRTLKESQLDIPFIVVSGAIGEETAVTALKAGAHDFLIKGKLARLVPAIERELREAAARHSQREAESKYQMLIEQLPIIVYVNRVDKIGSTTYVSPQLQTILGHKPEEWMADPEFWQKAVHPEDRQAVVEQSILAGELREPFDMEYRMMTRDGRVFWFRDHATLIQDNQGQPLFWQGIKIDITKRKEVEAERENLIAKLETTNAELERFVYTAFHDLRSPIVTIKGFLGMLKTNLQNNKQNQVQADIQRIEGAADKMDELLSGLLELSRIGRVINPIEEVDLVQLTQEALETLDMRMRSRNVTIKIAPDLPVVCGDRIRLREVLENLFDNAAKYASNQPNPIIKIGAREENSLPVIFVKDNGIGIDPRYHSRIFNLFERLDTTAEGTGIGLALVKRIIEWHGGKVWVESKGLGEGSTFCFTIPDRRDQDLIK